MLGQALPIDINLTSPVALFVVMVAFVVMALTVSTRRATTRPRAAAVNPPVPPVTAADARVRLAGEWPAAQALFLEDPRAGCAGALAIVDTLLRERRANRDPAEPLDARYIAARAAIANADASTDELRRGFVGLRGLFDEGR